jgi:hypothetical protein
MLVVFVMYLHHHFYTLLRSKKRRIIEFNLELILLYIYGLS